jgi:hypothetical protein
MRAGPSDLGGYGGGKVRMAMDQSNYDEARRYREGGYADIARYGGPEVRDLLGQWSMMDSIFMQTAEPPLEKIRDDLWAKVQAQYQAILDQGGGPPAAAPVEEVPAEPGTDGTETESDPEASPETDTDSDGGTSEGE